jgi:hypothetical protein
MDVQRILTFFIGILNNMENVDRPGQIQYIWSVLGFFFNIFPQIILKMRTFDFSNINLSIIFKFIELFLTILNIMAFLVQSLFYLLWYLILVMLKCMKITCIWFYHSLVSLLSQFKQKHNAMVRIDSVSSNIFSFHGQ